MRHQAPIDWVGNVTFAVGLILVMVGITYGIQPYGGHVMGWTNPKVVAEIGRRGRAPRGIFVIIEMRVATRCSASSCFGIRAFTFGTMSSFLSSLARGGLMFMLIIWLQGIWLPLHGFDFASTPLWAGISMLPLSIGIVVAGPISGYLSDRYGSRLFATGRDAARRPVLRPARAPADGLLPTRCSPLILFLSGIGGGAFASPNRAGVMNSLPPEHRGAGSGMNTTFQNSAQILSIGVFFTLMILGLSNDPAAIAPPRAPGPRGRRPPPHGRPPAADLDPLRRLPRLQPPGAPARTARAGATARAAAAHS